VEYFEDGLPVDRLDQSNNQQNMTTNYSTPSGFTEYSPKEQHLYDKVHKVVEDTYKKYGFSHIDTPAVERMEVLTAKGNQGDNII
jgi:histidyl-tRNA synthetase